MSVGKIKRRRSDGYGRWRWSMEIHRSRTKQNKAAVVALGSAWAGVPYDLRVDYDAAASRRNRDDDRSR